MKKILKFSISFISDLFDTFVKYSLVYLLFTFFVFLVKGGFYIFRVIFFVIMLACNGPHIESHNKALWVGENRHCPQYSSSGHADKDGYCYPD